MMPDPVLFLRPLHRTRQDVIAFGFIVLSLLNTSCQNRPDTLTWKTSTFVVEANIAVGKAPHGIRFSDDGQKAYVALAGEGHIAVVDLNKQALTKKLDGGDAPLDLLATEAGHWVVTQFQGNTLITPGSRSWDVGRGPSLFSPEIVEGKAFLVSEFADTLTVFDTRAERIVKTYRTGKRPYPADVTPDGVLAFVPNRTDSSVTVIDLLNEKTLATTNVCPRPEGGALSRDGVSYIVACGGSDELVFVNTASFEVTDRVHKGVGPRPFSVAVTLDGRFGLVNNAGGNTVSVLEIKTHQIVGSLVTGKQPVVVRMHPDGHRAFVSNEFSGTLTVILLPKLTKPPFGGAKNEVIVMGMIHGAHRTSTRYGLDTVRRLIRAINPDYVLPEIPPNRFDRAQREFEATGVVEEPRVKRFPEYVDALFPLTKDMNFEIIPTAAWNAPMSDYRNAVLRRISKDPARETDWAAYKRAEKEAAVAVASGGAPDDPRWIHTDAYDDAEEIELSVYNRLFNDEIGPGGWDHINTAHYANIARALDAHRGEGKRFLITYGAGHKGWFLRHLRSRNDITLLDVAPFLDAVGAN